MILFVVCFAILNPQNETFSNVLVESSFRHHCALGWTHCTAAAQTLARCH